MVVSLQFLPEAQIATVAEAGDNGLLGIHAWVDGGAPKRDIGIANGLSYYLNAFLCADDTGNVNALRSACLQESLVGSSHRATRCQHRIDDDERLTFH